MILTAENTKQMIQMQILCICEVILESCRSSQGGGLYTSFTPFLDLAPVLLCHHKLIKYTLTIVSD